MVGSCGWPGSVVARVAALVNGEMKLPKVDSTELNADLIGDAI